MLLVFPAVLGICFAAWLFLSLCLCVCELDDAGDAVLSLGVAAGCVCVGGDESLSSG